MFVKQGVMEVTDDRTGKRETREVVLFSDALIVCEPHRNNKLKLKKTFTLGSSKVTLFIVHLLERSFSV